jgi:hypothetical protein
MERKGRADRSGPLIQAGFPILYAGEADGSHDRNNEMSRRLFPCLEMPEFQWSEIGMRLE